MHGLQACCCCCIPHLCVVKMLLIGEVGDRVLNSHGNYIVDRGKSWKNHGIVFLNFCGKGSHRNESNETIYFFLPYEGKITRAVTMA